MAVLNAVFVEEYAEIEGSGSPIPLLNVVEGLTLGDGFEPMEPRVARREVGHGVVGSEHGSRFFSEE